MRRGLLGGFEGGRLLGWWRRWWGIAGFNRQLVEVMVECLLQAVYWVRGSSVVCRSQTG
jgi:hypothetical protein